MDKGKMNEMSTLDWEKYKEIIEFARKNDNQISYYVIADILRDKSLATKEDIRGLIERVEEDDICVVDANGDEYIEESEAYDSGFVPADINISQRTLTLYNVLERLENNEIELHPRYQRNADIWNEDNQSRLIESLMLKIPIPSFYFDAKKDEKWGVIDGLQRLSAFQNYLVGEKTRKFSGLQYLTDFNGLHFNELPRQYIRRIKETNLSIYTVEKETPEIVVRNIFQRINTGGEGLNQQEIRQALYSGKSTSLIERMANADEFKMASQEKLKSNRMADREYATRYIAFTILNYRTDYKNLDSFLSMAMKKVNEYSDSEINSIEIQFKRVMRFCAELFGNYAFRQYVPGGRRGPINKAIFDLCAVLFHQYEKKRFDDILMKREDFLYFFSGMLNDSEYRKLLRSGKADMIAKRIDIAREKVENFYANKIVDSEF